MTAQVSGRVLTVPNAISFTRLVGVPLFLYLFLVPHAYGWAVLVLAVGGTSDWVDGYLARRLGQVSRLGELLDPLADRLYILATLVAFTAGGVVSWLFTAALLLREVVLIGCLAVLRRYDYGPLPVHYLGKTATFILLAGFPVLLLAKASAGAAPVASPIGWALAWWGLALYWAAGVLYVIQTVHLVRARETAQA
jgi:cardiolipin synthase